LRIYCALLASLLLMALLFMLVMRLTGGGSSAAPRLEALAEAAGALLPPASSSRQAQEQSLEHWHSRAGADLALFSADGALIAFAGAAQDAPSAMQRSYWVGGHPPTVALKLPDGRWLKVRYGGTPGYGAWGIFGVLMLVGLAVAMAAWPVARRLTQRLEGLQRSVEKLGEGDLSARVPVQGQDEVARLAQSFNRAAGRIEALVGAQKSLLANASHELRSPLARIRMAAELQNGNVEPEARAELARNIAELDQLIDEILLASRLDAAKTAQEHMETVDLTALAAEECARGEVEFETDGLISVQGDARLLRRLVRNLIENARRYGGTQPIEVRLTRGAGESGVTLEVADRGPGVDPEECERIFEPFYRTRGASEREGGVGLGLALVRQIAARHGARAECLARDGGGSIFRVSGFR
jgi:signal transduction histidine kinase